MQPGDMVQRARDRAQLEHFDSLSFMEGLSVSLMAIDANKELDESERSKLYEICENALVTRLKVSDYLWRNPDVTKAPVKKPLFILGLPRSSSSLLCNLLSLDPRRRSLLRWEAAEPVPPAPAANLKTDPRCLRRLAEDMGQKDPLRHIHHERWDGPTECHFLLTQDFKSVGLETPIASPIYGEWLLQCDATPTYRYHQRYLQVLQSNAPGVWNLKQASHALNVAALLTVYPDAKLIWTHRDPYVVVASFMQMAAVVQEMSTGKPNLEYITKYGPRRLRVHVQRLMAMQDEASDDIFHHIFYDEFTQSPIREIKRLYAWLGDRLEPKVELAMTQWLNDNPKNKHGKHNYALSDFGLSIEQLQPHFHEYKSRFSL